MQVALTAREEGRADERCDRRGDHHDRPEAEDPPRVPAALLETGRPGDALGQVGEEDCREERDPGLASDRDREPEHDRLRHAIERGAQHDRESGAWRLGPVHGAHALPAEAVDQPVAEEEDHCTERHPDRDRDLAADADGLLDELEGDRADEHARAERHDQPELPVRDGPDQRDQRPDDQGGGGDRSPGGGEQAHGVSRRRSAPGSARGDRPRTRAAPPCPYAPREGRGRVGRSGRTRRSADRSVAAGRARR